MSKLRHQNCVRDKTKSASLSSVLSTQICSIQCGEQAHMLGFVEEYLFIYLLYILTTGTPIQARVFRCAMTNSYKNSRISVRDEEHLEKTPKNIDITPVT